MIDVSKMRLLKKSEVGLTYLNAFKDRFGKKHIDSKYTSLTSFLSYGSTNYVGGNYWLEDEKFSLIGPKSAYFVKNNRDNNKYEIKVTPASNKLAIRLVIPYEGELEQSIDHSTHSQFYFASAIKFGEYPQFDVYKDSVSTVLEFNYNNKTLDTTNKKYQINGSLVPEYIYNGKKYVRIELEQGNIKWFEVSPVEWIVDSKEKKLISSLCLNGNLTHNEACNMVKIMINDIVPSQVVKLHDDLTFLIDDDLKLSDEIINLINEIYEYIKESSKRDEYLKEIKAALDKYKMELEQLKPEFKKQKGLELGLSVPIVYSNLYAILMNIHIETKTLYSKKDKNNEVIVKERRIKKDQDYTREDINSLIFNSIRYLRDGTLNGELLENIILIRDLIENAPEEEQERFTSKAVEVILNFQNKCHGIDYNFFDLNHAISRYLDELSRVIKKQNNFDEQKFIENALLETKHLLHVKNKELAEQNMSEFKSNELKILESITTFINDIVACYKTAFEKVNGENKEKLKLFFYETLKKCNVIILGEMTFDALKQVAIIYDEFQEITSNIIEYYQSIDKVC